MRAILAALALLSAAPVTAHPMDGLTAPELTRAIGVLRAGGQLTTGKVATVTLIEPPKTDVLAWMPGHALPRRALVRALQDARAYEGEVDLDTRRVVRWAAVPGRQPSFMLGELLGSIEVVKADASWRTAMARRGYTDFSHILCNPLAVGYVPDPALRARRLMNVPCFDATGARNNTFARPIEGLMALVDLNARRVVRLIDLGVVPVPPTMPQHDYASQDHYRRPMRAVVMAEPQGDNIRITGGEIAWDNWRFHLRLDRRVGPVASLIRWDDHGRLRPIAYQIAPSEMFVPYMDPAPTWSFKSYLDAGEYGLGLEASPLQPGRDCPTTAHFIDAVFTDDDGKPVPIARASCVFERNIGDPAWRHQDPFTGDEESRPGVDLVVRSIAVIGNYDYILDYVFTQTGEIEVRVGATGIDAVKGVRAQSMRDPTAAADSAVGTLVAPGLVAVSHEHYVNFRLDLDVDGTANRAVLDRIEPQRIATPGRRSLWRVRSEPLTRAGPLHLMEGLLRIESADQPGPLGHHPSYELLAGHAATSLMDADDPVAARAGFTTASTWLTAYNPVQLHAAGEWPNQSGPGEGLPAWVRATPVLGPDLVVWQTIGFRHITRTEDWPIMPTLWHSFRLRPHNFFRQNPAMDIPPDFARAPTPETPQ
jgi:primary-amine oxidase